MKMIKKPTKKIFTDVIAKRYSHDKIYMVTKLFKDVGDIADNYMVRFESGMYTTHWVSPVTYLDGTSEWSITGQIKKGRWKNSKTGALLKIC